MRKKSFIEPSERLPDCLDEWGPDLSERVRRAPLKSVALAVGVGYLSRFIPARAVACALGRMLLALVWPALLVFGLVKLNHLRGKKGEGYPSIDLEFPRSLDSH